MKTRRWKLLSMDAQLLANVLRPRPERVITTVYDNVPEGAELERVLYNWASNSFDLVFSHPDWDEVPPSQSPPYINMLVHQELVKP